MTALIAWLAFVGLAAGVVVWNVVADRAAKRAVEAGLRRELGWMSAQLGRRGATTGRTGPGRRRQGAR
ncbi:MAG TPA: hypothetical protein VGP26_24695 [Actinophytocola sp.]|nr:hypothetical protein [Actinophytocola sp.]